MEDQRLRQHHASYQTINDSSEVDAALEAEADVPSLKSSGLLPFTVPTTRRFSKSLRGCLVLVALFSVVSVSWLHVRSLLPTEKEIALAQHYYGDSVNHNLPWDYATSQIRQAQKIADEAIEKHLQSNNDQRRALREHDSELQEGCESTVIILRHCEKGRVTEHCAYDGFERSVYLASLFGDDKNSRWPLPIAIFAEAPDDRYSRTKMNFREVETVGPLAEIAEVTVDDSYSDRTLTQLGKNILDVTRQGKMCGRTTVIVWKHSRIAHLARVLGCGPSHGCPVDYHGRSFDQVWQIKFVYDTWKHSSTRHWFVQGIERPSWKVFGSVQSEGFDPLAVSKEYGDYPARGTATGGRWKTEEVAYPERKRFSDTGGWRMKRVGFSKQINSEFNEGKDGN